MASVDPARRLSSSEHHARSSHLTSRGWSVRSVASQVGLPTQQKAIVVLIIADFDIHLRP